MDLKTLNQFSPLTKLTVPNHRDVQVRTDQLITYERSKRKSSLHDDEDLISKRRCLDFQRKIEDNECANDGIFVAPPRFKSGQVSIRQRSDAPLSSQAVKHDEFANDAFYKPWLDSFRLKRQRLGDDEDPSSSSSPSEVDIAALTLLQFSCDRRHPQTQTLTRPQPQTHKTQLQRPPPQLQSQTQTAPPKSDLFKCSICEKVFTSYQALGGHKASHSIKAAQLENAGADAGEKTRSKMLSPSGKIHKCDICHVLFPTGQALGGHKRRHYEGLLGGHKRGNDEAVLKLSPNSNKSVVTKVLDAEQSLRASDNIHKRNQDEVVPSRDKSSLSNVSVVKNVLDLKLSLGESDGGHKDSQDEVVVHEDKCSPSSNGSIVTNVSDPEQSVRRLIDLNNPPSLEFDQSRGGDVEEVEKEVVLALSSQMKQPSKDVSALIKRLEFAMQERKDGLLADDNVLIEMIMELEGNISTTNGDDEDPYSEGRLIKVIEPIGLDEDDECVEIGLGSCEQEPIQERFGDDKDPSSDHGNVESIRLEEEDAVLFEPWLKSRDREQSQRQGFGEYEDCFSERRFLQEEEEECFGDDEDSFSDQISFLESNRLEEEFEEEKEAARFSNDNDFVELLFQGIEQSKPKPKSCSYDDDDDGDEDDDDDDDDDVDPSSKDIRLEEENECENRAVIRPSLNSVAPNQQRFGDDEVPSSSSSLSKDETAALCPTPHSQTQPQSQTQLQKVTQPQTQMLPKSDSYQCNVCGRELPSYQALGGHKASHRTKPPVENATGEKMRPKKLAPSGKIHKCSICHREFSTGQSLGGHKRLHYEGVLRGHKRSQEEEAVSQGDKLSPSGNGSVVTHVPDPKQSRKGLIVINKVPSPEFNDPGDKDILEGESALLANKLEQDRGITSTRMINGLKFFNFL
ncbi:unnamed protein product [Arabidopsis thaliana]|uniref:C2H2-type domain-containing protein n=1 Tax=Arabidopsis thaliana TaxID=3702 RepID=A0A5S9WNC0_ARATH|nr:unnamed protein product [Arabidopsis thaliana]